MSKLTDKPVGVVLTLNDLIHIVQVNDLTGSPFGTSKQYTLAILKALIGGGAAVDVNVLRVGKLDQNTTVDIDSNTLTFDGGEIHVKTDNETAGTTAFKVETGGGVALEVKGDKFVGVNAAAQDGTEVLGVNGRSFFIGRMTIQGDAFVKDGLLYMRRGTSTRGWLFDNTTDNLLQIGSGFNGGHEFVIGANANRHNVIDSDGTALNIVKRVIYGEEGGVTNNSARVGVELKFMNNYFDVTSKETFGSLKYKGTDNLGASAFTYSIEGVDILTLKSDGVTVFKTFTVATLPPAVAGGQIFVSDATGSSLTGSMCFSNGTVWIDMTTGVAAV